MAKTVDRRLSKLERVASPDPKPDPAHLLRVERRGRWVDVYVCGRYVCTVEAEMWNAI